MKITSIDLTRKGFGKILGDLELELMDCLWGMGEEVSARAVTDCLNTKRSISFNAVSTVLNRLCDKGFIKKNAVGKRYSFEALISKEDLSQKMIDVIVESLVEDEVINENLDLMSCLKKSL